MDPRELHRKVSSAVDLGCLIGFPLGLGIAVNYILGIGMLVFVAVVTILRRRHLDDKVEVALYGVAKDEERKETIIIGGALVKVLVLVAVAATMLTIGAIGIYLVVGEASPRWPLVALAAIWLGVLAVAVGARLDKR
jgi:uncharacterized membrane protein